MGSSVAAARSLATASMIVVATTLTTFTARAGGPKDASDPAAAEALFQQARAAAAKGDWPSACASFAESLRLEPAPGTRLNLADCEEHANLLARAWQDYEAVAAELPAKDPRRALALSRASTLSARLPRLVVRLAPGAPPNTRVSRDGVELGPSSYGVALPVDPGRHVLTLTVAERSKTLDVDVVERETREVVLDARDAAPSKALAKEPSNDDAASREKGSSSRSSADERSDGRRVVGLTALGLGAAGIALGSIAGLIALDAASDVRTHCDADRRCDADGLDAGSRARSWSTISTIAFAAGVAGVAVGGYFLIVSPSPAAGTTVSVRGTF